MSKRSYKITVFISIAFSYRLVHVRSFIQSRHFSLCDKDIDRSRVRSLKFARSHDQILKLELVTECPHRET